MIKVIAKNIESKGFLYKQELRNENYAIYSQWLNNDLIAYELIKIRKNNECERFGKIIGASESYPTDKEWGDRGWTFKSFADAKKRLFILAPELANLHSPTRVEATSFWNPIESALKKDNSLNICR